MSLSNKQVIVRDNLIAALTLVQQLTDLDKRNDYPQTSEALKKARTRLGEALEAFNIDG